MLFKLVVFIIMQKITVYSFIYYYTIVIIIYCNVDMLYIT